jgi:ethylbenzene dioxygenase subunit beta
MTTLPAPRARAVPDTDTVARFLFHEARLLDEKRWEAWAELFTEDGTYWIPTMPDQVDPYTRASIMYDDRTMMAMRIRRLRHPQIHAQTPPSRTAHLVTNVLVEPEPDADGLVEVGACFLMLEYRHEQQTVHGGRYRYRLAVADDGLRIRAKTVHMVNCDAAHHLMAIYL